MPACPLRIAIVLLVGLSLLPAGPAPTVAARDDGDPTLLATGRVAFGMTDGEYVVWQELDPDWQVPPALYGARLDDREPFIIGRLAWESGYYELVRIADGWAVWPETDSPVEPARWSIHAMNLATREAVEVAAMTDRPGSVVLDDGVVVWSEASERQSGVDTIRGLELTTGTPLEIASGTEYIVSLAILGSMLAWQATEGWNTSYLNVRDIASMAPAETIATIPSAGSGPGVRSVALMAVQGQRLYWREWFETSSDPGNQHARVLTQAPGDGSPAVLASGDAVEFAAAMGKQVFIQDGAVIRHIDASTGESVTLGHGTGLQTDGDYAFWHTAGLFGVGQSPQLVGADLQTGVVHAFDIDGIARHVANGVVIWTEGVGPERELHAARAGDLLPADTQPQGPMPTNPPSWTQPFDAGDWSAASTSLTIPGTVSSFDVDLPWMVWAQDGIKALNLETGETTTFDTDNPGWYIDVADGMVLWSAYDSGSIEIRNLWSGAAFTIAVTPSQGAWSPPKVSRDWAVWVEFPPYSPEDPNPNAPGIMYAQRLWSGSERFVVSEGSSWVAGLSGDLVALVEPSASDPARSRIVVRNLATSETVYEHETGLYVYPLDIEGSTLVYSEFASCAESPIGGCDEPHTISVVDLDSGEARTLRSHINTHEGGFPIITDGRFVLFERGGGVGYDLALDAWFPAPSHLDAVKLDDGMLVWTTRADVERGPTSIHILPAEEFSTGQHTRYIADAGHWVSFDLLTFWDTHGGQEVFGAPLTEPRPTGDPLDQAPAYAAQWFEHGRMELHPENAGTVYAVQLGRLGAELLAGQGRDWQSFPTASPDAAHYYPQTGHAIAPEFWGYWSSHGLEFGVPGVAWDESVALFGYPISEPMLETDADGATILTQYFERAVFEYHPDNPPESQVLLRPLGAELLGDRGR